ncbi:MAG: antibiotic biosynthesis monooxygenase [Rhodothermales bacterium]
MILVLGYLRIQPGQRDAFLAGSLPAVCAARKRPGCVDFSVSADPLDENRINVSEQWESRRELMAFRESGPEDDLWSLVAYADVQEYEVA